VDFALGETQQAVAAAVAQVLDRSPAPGDTDDRALWKELGQAGLLGLALPAWLGGDGCPDEQCPVRAGAGEGSGR
jgi:3-oxo-4-pregnene-20-carboxyl-CoA dehydrogenase alpha subunit